MGTGIVIAVADKVIAVLCSQELKDICSMFGYESQLNDLNKTVVTIKSVLLDAESKHQELTHAGRDYIERLKEAVYDVDDLLDEFNFMIQKEKNKKGGNKVSKKVRRFFSRSNQFLVAFNMSNEIKSLRSKLDKIAKDRQQFGFSDVYLPVKRRQETMSYASDDHIIGREIDKDAVVGMLLGGSNSANDVDYVTIVGFGGLGKTALARLVYNDHRIEEAFELMMWVCVSDDFCLDKIFQQMLGTDGSKIEELQREVRKLIQGRRYLLVLDDVWSESRAEWDNLKLFLNLGGRGSRVVVTSRSKKVARVVGDDLLYELKGLSNENSWNLFKRLAFEQGKEPLDCDDPFFEIGKEIVKKCANVPLSIRVVGSMLYDQDESKWLSLKSANLMEIAQGEDGVMPILKYSYYHLTPALKSCFSYCALFPKDFMIKKKVLMRLWLAHGCLDQSHGCRSEEDVGEEYFSILFHRCFFQDIKKDVFGEIKCCKMHDLIHDLAIDVAGNETIILDSLKGPFDKRICHLSFAPNECHLLANPVTQLSKMKTLRSFMASPKRMFPTLCASNVTGICSHLRRLRVLHLHDLWFDTLPSTVGNLLHLRYLDLSKNMSLKVLPNSITKLLNLLVLNLNDTSIRELPHDMRKLINLRHLSLCYCRDLKYMPPGLDTLTCLHVLTTFVAGDEIPNQGNIGKLRDLKTLVNLRDELTIKFDENFNCDVTEYEEVELLRLAPLKHLIIVFNDKRADNHKTVLSCLQPHCRLTTISIEGYRGLKLPTWTESLATSLPHLVNICLVNFDCIEILPSLSQLRHLKRLMLKGMSDAEYVESDAVVVPSDNQLIFFPSLVRLDLIRHPKLRGWWREETSMTMGKANSSSSVVIPSFPCLRDLVLVDCPHLTALPSCPELKSLEWRGCNEALSLFRSKTAFHLNNLTTDNVEAIDRFFGESLGVIKKLSIHYFKGENLSNAIEKCARHIASVEVLKFKYCENLKNLSGFVEHLSSLQSLEVADCRKFGLQNDEEEVNVTLWRSLRLLTSLKLDSLPKLSNLPKEFQYLTSLEFLKISHCKNLEALPEWLKSLTSLKSLSIFACPKLKSLPEAIAHMPSLKNLDLVYTGPVLEERCRKPDGEDWPKICHIPHISFESS